MVKMWPKMPLLYPFYRFIWNTVDWLFPPFCVGCGKTGFSWCEHCQEVSRIKETNICPICGNIQAHKNVCSSCRDDPPAFTGLRSWGIYSGALREAIHQFKYQSDVSLGNVFAQNLYNCYTALGWNVDFIVPVPLHPNRLRSRGYNQSALIAFPLALKLGIPYLSKAIIRKRDTHSQVGLSSQERKENIQDAFVAENNLVEGKTALVIDDVTTTGATMRACANSLISAGASAVYGMTLARTVYSDNS